MHCTRGKSKRIIRICVTYSLASVYLLRLLLLRTDYTKFVRTVPPLALVANHTVAAEDDDHITLCGKRINLPVLLLTEDTNFGVYKWNRDINNAIVLDNRTGYPYDYGRTGNQIREVFHAFDLARDNGGALIFHTSGFPMDAIIRKLFLGVERSELEKRLGVTFYHNIDEVHLPGMKIFSQEEAYHYVSKDQKYSMFDAIEHRHYIIRQLYQMTAKSMVMNPNSPGVADMCASMHALFGKDSIGERNVAGISKPITKQYTVIHSRQLENMGKAWMNRAQQEFGVDNRAGMDFPVDMISSVLSPLGMLNSTILMITDGQNAGVVHRLSSDPIIGKVFQVVPEEISTVTGDLMLAILSDVFIGNPIR